VALSDSDGKRFFVLALGREATGTLRKVVLEA
jgi:hypothetical protein